MKSAARDGESAGAPRAPPVASAASGGARPGAPGAVRHGREGRRAHRQSRRERATVAAPGKQFAESGHRGSLGPATLPPCPHPTSRRSRLASTGHDESLRAISDTLGRPHRGRPESLQAHGRPHSAGSTAFNRPSTSTRPSWISTRPSWISTRPSWISTPRSLWTGTPAAQRDPAHRARHPRPRARCPPSARATRRHRAVTVNVLAVSDVPTRRAAGRSARVTASSSPTPRAATTPSPWRRAPSTTPTAAACATTTSSASRRAASSSRRPARPTSRCGPASPTTCSRCPAAPRSSTPRTPRRSSCGATSSPAPGCWRRAPDRARSPARCCGPSGRRAACSPTRSAPTTPSTR